MADCCHAAGGCAWIRSSAHVITAVHFVLLILVPSPTVRGHEVKKLGETRRADGHGRILRVMKTKNESKHRREPGLVQKAVEGKNSHNLAWKVKMIPGMHTQEINKYASKRFQYYCCIFSCPTATQPKSLGRKHASSSSRVVVAVAVARVVEVAVAVAVAVVLVLVLVTVILDG